MAEGIDGLKEKLRNRSGESSGGDGNPLNFVDGFWGEVAGKVFALLGILICGSWLYIIIEKAVTVRTIIPYRASILAIAWGILCWRQPKFLKFGLWQWLTTLAIIPNLAQFFREFILNTVK